jgi:7-keto-8-aminopelargonate synthetase-like enzyme
MEPDSLQFLDGNRVRWRGRELLYFGGCDYFRMSRHPAVLNAASRGLDRLGLNVAASRLTTGNHPVYRELETRLAGFFGAPETVLVPSGYLTGTTAAQAMAGDFDRVLMDERSHPALQDAALHFGCPVRTFGHRDPADLGRKVRSAGPRQRVVVLTDGMFSLDGSVAPLQAYLACLPPTAVILVDDAHGAGLLGGRGRGSLEHEGVGRDRLVQCITLSKAFGVYGGAVVGARSLRRRIVKRSRAFLGCTPLPLPLAHAALQSVRLLERGTPMRQRLWRNADHVKTALRRAGFAIPDQPGPIVALHPRSTHDARRLKACLLDAGIHAPMIRYAGAPDGVFRFVISSEHTAPQLERLIAALARFKGAGRSVGGTGSGPARKRAARR